MTCWQSQTWKYYICIIVAIRCNYIESYFKATRNCRISVPKLYLSRCRYNLLTYKTQRKHLKQTNFNDDSNIRVMKNNNTNIEISNLLETGTNKNNIGLTFSTLEESELHESESNTNNLTPQYISLALLLLIFSSNQWCRQAIYYLCNFSNNANPYLHMNIDLNFDSEMYAALASFGFTVVFSLFSLIAGNIADKYNRKNIIVIACFVWSIVTLLQFQAVSFYQLIPLRIALGISQAFFNPAAFTLISDIFPKNLVGQMNGILSGGVYIGGGLASLSILLDNNIGWRSTVLAIGLLGILSAFLGNLFIYEPKIKSKLEAVISRSSNSASENMKNSSSVSSTNDDYDYDVVLVWSKNIRSLQTSIYEASREIFNNKEVCYILLATGIRFCAGFTIGIWKAPFVFEKFPEEISIFAGTNAAIVSIGGFLSSYLGGYLSDKIFVSSTISSQNNISNNNTRIQESIYINNNKNIFLLPKLKARLWVPALGSLLAAPLFVKFILSTSAVEASGWLLLEYLVAECWIGPTLAALFESVGNSRRGFAQGIFSLLIAFGNMAPLIVSYFLQLKNIDLNMFSTIVGSNSNNNIIEKFNLSDILIVVVSFCYILSGIFFSKAAILYENKSDKLK